MNNSFRKMRLGDMLLFTGVLIVILTMIAPILPFFLDLLVGLNIGMSVLIFCLAIFIKQPLIFSGFPTVLLMATIYRLAINISSTRLILSKADPGQIIGGFGNVVVGDDLIVGAVIFSIILMVLFFVITKGAGRVAEVAARFTLDALPGMQIAIESDLRSKAISPRDLIRKRTDLEQKSMFYGSLDGAMKFVRGDAMAALFVTLINLIGGITIGIFRNSMSFGEALNIYGRLTIGDGLVTMIPALLISTAAGFLVTRVGEGDKKISLGTRLGKQLFSEPLAIISSIIILNAIAFIPALPAWPFLLVSFTLSIIFTYNFFLNKNIKNSSKQRPKNAKVIGLDEMQAKLDSISEFNPVLVKEAFYGRVSLAYMSDIFSEFSQDGLGDEYLCDLLEALAREKISEDIDDMIIRLRRRMSHIIENSFSNDKKLINVFVFDKESEDILTENISNSAMGKSLNLSFELVSDLVNNIKKALHDLSPDVLVVSSRLRRPLARLLFSKVSIKVISTGELSSSREILIKKKLSI